LSIKAGLISFITLPYKTEGLSTKMYALGQKNIFMSYKNGYSLNLKTIFILNDYNFLITKL
jgi:hypothetical protein